MNLLPHGQKIGNATVIVDIISSDNAEIRPGRKMIPRYITDHDTGNKGRGANALAHNQYLHNMASYHPRDTKSVSWHITVDEQTIIQHLPLDEIAWHCGDGVNGKGNLTSIGVEKCMNVDGNRQLTEENAIALYVYLNLTLKITANNIYPHQYWSGKNCPAVILQREGSFNKFRKRIEMAIRESNETEKNSNTLKSTSTIKTLKIDGYLGELTIRALQRYFGTPVDGVISKPSTVIKALQKLLNVTADGYFGAVTISAMQQRFGTPVDGFISKPSLVIKELQRKLNKGRL